MAYYWSLINPTTKSPYKAILVAEALIKSIINISITVMMLPWLNIIKYAKLENTVPNYQLFISRQKLIEIIAHLPFSICVVRKSRIDSRMPQPFLLFVMLWKYYQFLNPLPSDFEAVEMPHATKGYSLRRPAKWILVGLKSCYCLFTPGRE